MKPNDRLFLEQLDIISQGCRTRNTFTRMWKKLGIEHTIKYCPMTELQREKIKELIVKYEIT